MDEKLKEAIEFFAKLFNPGEQVWVTNDLGYTTAVSQAQALQRHVGCDSEKGSYIAVNPASQAGVPRGSSHVGQMRNFLIEFDDLPIKEQRPFFESKGVPYSASVFSGGKSHHFVVSLTEPVATVHEYKALFRRMHVLFEEKNDPATKDPGRWMRFPNAVRGGRLQKVNKIGTRITQAQLMGILNKPENLARWRASKHYQEEARQYAKIQTGSAGRDKFLSLIRWYVQDYLKDSFNQDKGFYPCPVCVAEGGDNAGDNMYITPSNDWRVHCFAGDELHNRAIHKVLDAMKKAEDTPYEVEEENCLKISP